MKVSYGLSTIRLTQTEQEFWFDVCDALKVVDLLETNQFSAQRVILKKKSGRKVADLRRGGLYLIPDCPYDVKLPVPAESADFFSGYYFKYTPKVGDVVFDVGAYCGEMTLSMAHKVGPTGRVISFEPDPDNFRWLQENVERAGLKNVTLIPRGLWNETTVLRFAVDANVGSHVSLTHQFKATREIEVPVVSFEEACRLAGAVPNFVKMDIEGAEVEAIQGAKEFIRAHDIRFAIASYHQRDGGKTCAILEPLFRELGYQAETGYAAHLTTWASKR